MANADDFDLGDLDLDDFGADPTVPSPEKMKDDRNVVTTVATNFADGVKSTAFESQFIKSTMKKSLPDGYGKAMDLADDVIDTGKDLYDSAAKTLKPTLLAMHKTAKQLAPGIDNFLPKAIVDKINDLNTSDSERASLAKADWQENEINGQLGEIFKTQVEAQTAIAAEQQTNEAQARVETKATNTTLISLVDAIRVANERMVGYQDAVTAKYQRKHLELTYRQYFATKDLLETTQKDNVTIIDLLQGVMKNTGLPEHVKVNMSEMASQNTKEKLIGFAQNKIGNYASNFMRNVAKNAHAKAQQVLSQVNNNLQDAIMLGDQLAMAKEAQADMASMGIDDGSGSIEGMAGNMAGGQLAEYLGGIGSKWILKAMEKSPTVRKGNQLFNYGIDNGPELLSEWARSPTEDLGFKGDMINFIKSVIPKGGVEDKITQDHLAIADQAAAFTNRTAKSINEIIPGYLARILQSVETIRTGGKKAPMAVFDYEDNAWSNEAAIDDKNFKKLLPKRGIEELNSEINKLIDSVDADGVLTADQRSILLEQIIKDVSSNKGFSPQRFSQSRNYSVNGASSDVDAISALFKEKYNVNDDGKMSFEEQNMSRVNRDAAMYRRLSRNVPDIADKIFTLYNQGNQDSLRRLGLIKNDDGEETIDYDYIHSIYRGAERNPGTVVLDDSDTVNKRRRGPRPSSRSPKTLSAGPAPKSPFTTAGRQGGSANGGIPQDMSAYADLLGDQTDQIVSAIKDNRITPEVRDILKLVQEMVTQQTAQLSGDYQKRAKSRLGRLFQSTGNLVGDTWGVLKSPLKGIGKMYGGAAAGIGTALRLGGFVPGTMLGAAGSLLGGFFKLGDLYVKGKQTAALTVDKLKRGDYYDSVTGKAIKSWKDLKKLKGDVMDRAGNVVALSKDEIMKWGVYEHGKNILGSVGRMGRGVFDFATGQAGNLLSIGTSPYRAAKWLAVKGYEWAMKPEDVYTPDDLTKPKLYSTIFKAGGYYSDKSKQVLKDWDQIDGAVRFTADDTFALTEEQVKLGLVDKNGKPLKTAFNKIKDGITSVFKLPKKVFNKIKGLYKGGFEFLGNTIAGLFNLLDNTLFSRVNKQQVEILTEIRDMIRKQWGHDTGDKDGDGYRDGSWQEKRARKSKDKKAGKDTDKTSMYSKAKKLSEDGIVKTAKDWALKKIWDRIKGKGDDDEDEGASRGKRALNWFKRRIGWTDGADRNSPEAKSVLVKRKGWLKQKYDDAKARWDGSDAKRQTKVKSRWFKRKAKGVRDDIQNSERYKQGMGAATEAFNVARNPMSTRGKLFWHRLGGNKKLTAAEKYDIAKTGYKDYVDEEGTTIHQAGEALRNIADRAKANAKANGMSAVEFVETVLRIDRRTAGIADDVDALDGQIEGIIDSPSLSTVPTDSATQPVKRTKRTKEERRAAAAERLERMRNRRGGVRGRFGGIKTGIKGALMSGLAYAGSSVAGEVKDDAMGAATDAVTNYVGDHKDQILDAVVGDGIVRDVAESAYDAGSTMISEKALTTAGSWVARAATAAGGAEGMAALGAGALEWGGTAAAAGGIISAPVLLGAAAVAGAGVAAYYGYKWFKGRLDTLERIRFAQYGVNLEDKDQISQVKDLEDELMDYVQFNGSVASLSEMKNGIVDLLEIFDIGPKDSGRQDAWVDWFTNRFKPVFLTHLTVLKLLDPSAELDDVDDDLADNLKRSYLDKVKMDDLPMPPESVRSSPFGTEKLGDTRGAIAEAFKAAYDEVSKTESKASDTANSKPSILPESSMAAYASAYGVKTDAVGNTTASLPTANISPRPMDVYQGKTYADADSSSKAALKEKVVSNISNFQAAYAKRIDALNAVKYRAYGLQSMDAMKVNLLKRLESAVIKDTVYGSGGIVEFNGDSNQYFADFHVQFGCPDSADERNQWIVWFNNRFLPLWTNWCAAIRKVSSAIDPIDGVMSLSAGEMLTVAECLMGTTYDLYGTGKPVWYVDARPWPNYEPNIDPSSVEPNMDYIRNMVKRKELVESVAPGSSDQDDSTAGNSKSNPFSSTPSMMSSWKGTGYRGTVNSNIGGQLNYMTNGAAAFGGDPYSGIGVPIVHPGHGTGGDINNIPLPNGDGSWDALKDTIVAASKMAGVDPGIMATMAAIESSFRAGVSNKKSSASGLYQFIDETWATMLRKYGSKYGIAPNTPKSDPRANALMGAEFLKENMEYLQKHVKRPLTDVDMYAAHFMGAAGASDLLTAPSNADAVQLFPKQAVSNRDIFAPGGKHNTVAEVIQELGRRVQSRSSKYATLARNYAGNPTTSSQVQSTGGTGSGNVPDLLMRPSANNSASDTSGGTSASSAFSAPSNVMPTAASTASVPSLIVSKKTDSTASSANVSTTSALPTPTSLTAAQSAVNGATANRGVETTAVAPITTAATANDVSVANYQQQLANRTAQIDTQQRSLAASDGGTLSTIANTLNDSLNVQREMSTKLSEIRDAIGNLGSSTSSSTSTSSSSVNPDTVKSSSLSAPKAATKSLTEFDLPVSFKRSA